MTREIIKICIFFFHFTITFLVIRFRNIPRDGRTKWPRVSRKRLIKNISFVFTVTIRLSISNNFETFLKYLYAEKIYPFKHKTVKTDE